MISQRWYPKFKKLVGTSFDKNVGISLQILWEAEYTVQHFTGREHLTARVNFDHNLIRNWTLLSQIAPASRLSFRLDSRTFSGDVFCFAQWRDCESSNIPPLAIFAYLRYGKRSCVGTERLLFTRNEKSHVMATSQSRPVQHEFGKSSLSHGWIQCRSKRYPKRLYFHNVNSGCNTWNRPISRYVNVPTLNTVSQLKSWNKKKHNL